VNVIVDLVVNQMAGGSGTGSGGSQYDAGFYVINDPFNGLTKHLQYFSLLQSYPGVPYSSLDFNDNRCTIDYNDAWSIRNCALLGMSDLNQGKEYVREKIAEYANDLLDIGVKGFRVDAAKHMYPGDVVAFVNKFQDTIDGKRPFVYQEVIDYKNGEPVFSEEYFNSGKVTEFRYLGGLTCIRGRDWHCLDGFSVVRIVSLSAHH